MFNVMYPWWMSQHQNQTKLLKLSRCSAGDKLTSPQTSVCVPAQASWRWGSRPGGPWSPWSTCWCRCRAPSGRRGCRTPRCGRWRAAAWRRLTPDQRPEREILCQHYQAAGGIFTVYSIHCQYCHVTEEDYQNIVPGWQNVWLNHSAPRYLG